LALLTLDGNRANNSSGGRAIFSFGSTASNLTVRGCTIKNTYLDGINFRVANGDTVENVRFVNNDFVDCRDHGIFVQIETDNNGSTLLDGLYCEGNTFRDIDNSIALTASAYPVHGSIENIHFTDNTVENCPASITLEGESLNSAVISDNTVRSSQGIAVSAGNREVTVSNNTIKNVSSSGTRSGIRVYNGSRFGTATIVGNTIINPDRHGVFLEFAENCLVNSNRVEDANFGVAEDSSGADYNNVDGNIFVNMANGGVGLNGANSVQSDNLVR